MHRKAESLAPGFKIRELVKGRASGRQQHNVTRLSVCCGLLDSVSHIAAIHIWDSFAEVMHQRVSSFAQKISCFHTADKRK